MTAQNAAASDRTTLTAWREYRLSLVLLAAGVAMVVAVSGFSIWAPFTSGTSFWTGLAMQVAFTAGAMLILLAGTVAYYHRSFLRESRRST
jgi:uncharacterized membrane protein YczE